MSYCKIVTYSVGRRTNFVWQYNADIHADICTLNSNSCMVQEDSLLLTRSCMVQEDSLLLTHSCMVQEDSLLLTRSSSDSAGCESWYARPCWWSCAHRGWCSSGRSARGGPWTGRTSGHLGASGPSADVLFSALVC